MESNNLESNNNFSKKLTILNLLYACVGFVLGAAGIFGIMRLVDQNTTKCKDCACPKCPVENNLTTSFLTLEPSEKNIIYSPLSIRYGLSLLSAGASGKTKTEIDKLLGDGELPTYTNVKDELSLANAVFIRDTFASKVLPTYVDIVTQKYKAEFFYDSFKSSDNMDQWVSDKTFDLIDSIGIQPKANTEMVLANALAIKMDWQYKFDAENTMERPFHKADGSETMVSTMNETMHAEDVKYSVNDQATLVSLPLRSTDESEIEFVAILPSGDLTKYIEELDVSEIETALTKANSASEPEGGVSIYIPKFKFDYELNFKEDLNRLGIEQAFLSSADFSNMANEKIAVDEAIHKANIDFSEKGIKAAALTAFSVKSEGMIIDVKEPVAIKIDKPFLFLIRDQKNSAIWFIGAVYEPGQ